MAASVTLAQMIAMVRRRANIVSQTGFIDDAELTDELNEALADLYDMLVGVGGQPWFRNSVTFSTVANTDAYDLTVKAPDFYKLQSIDIDFGGGIFRTARPFMEEERNLFKYPLSGWIYQLPVLYRLQGKNLTFIPSPAGVYSVTVNYYPVFTKLVNVGDTFDGINGFESYAIWTVVGFCKQKGDEDASFAMQRAAQKREQILAMAASRDVNHNERIAEAYGLASGPTSTT
jgi:hypothetical protein